MNTNLLSRLALPLALSLPCFSTADTSTITLEKNSVIPVRFDNEISTRHSDRGDRISATVSTDKELPSGTRFLGRVTNVKRKSGSTPAYIELEFTEIELPGGKRTDIRALPISLEGGAVKRTRDGRYRTTGRVVRREQTVLGTAAAGIVIAAILKEDLFRGAFYGAIAGVVLAETQRGEQENNATIRRGTRMGALIEETVDIEYDGRWDRRDGEGSWGDDQGRRDREPQISYQGRDFWFDGSERPFWNGDVAMVHLKATARQMGMRVQDRFDEISIEAEGDEIIIEEGSDRYRLNGRSGRLARTVEKRNGELFVPIEVFETVSRESIRVDD